METTYTKARANLEKLCDKVVENNEVVYITRRNAENVALISKSELDSLLETAHLLRSPKNAVRLLKAFNDAKRNKTKSVSVDKLKIITGL